MNPKNFIKAPTEVCLAENQYGKCMFDVFQNTYYITGDKDKFIANLEKDLESDNPLDVVYAKDVLNTIKDAQEI